jgi:hypothetical protein
MKKNFKTMKATLIMGLLLVSLFVSIIPTTSAAGGFISLESYVNVNYDESITNEPIMIRGTGKAATINITYGVTGASLFTVGAQILLAMHYGRTVKIKVEPFNFPDWASVSVSEWPTAKIQAGEKSYPVTLIVKVDENAPAYGKGDIKLRITVPDVGLIKGIVDEISIPFSVGYTPIVTHQVVGGENQIIGPMDTAVFPIELTNMGNARTRVKLEITNIPDGWSAIITNDVVLEEGAGSKATVYLTVRPPKGFGYHDESASILIKYTPEMVEQPSFFGESRPIGILVDSRGFSVIGIEMVILPLIIIIVILLFIYYFIIKKRLGK